MANAENKDKVYAKKTEHKREYRKIHPEKTNGIQYKMAFVGCVYKCS